MFREPHEPSDRIVYDAETGKIWGARDGSDSLFMSLLGRVQPGIELTAADFLIV